MWSSCITDLAVNYMRASAFLSFLLCATSAAGLSFEGDLADPSPTADCHLITKNGACLKYFADTPTGSHRTCEGQHCRTITDQALCDLAVAIPTETQDEEGLACCAANYKWEFENDFPCGQWAGLQGHAQCAATWTPASSTAVNTVDRVSGCSVRKSQKPDIDYPDRVTRFTAFHNAAPMEVNPPEVQRQCTASQICLCDCTEVGAPEPPEPPKISPARRLSPFGYK